MWSFASPSIVICNAICCLALTRAKSAISFSRLCKLQRRMSLKYQGNKAIRDSLAVQDIGLLWLVFMGSFCMNVRCFCLVHKTTSNSFCIAVSESSVLPSVASIVMHFEITLNSVLNQSCQIPGFDLERTFRMLQLHGLEGSLRH